MISEHFLQGRRRSQLSDQEKLAIEEMLSPPVTIPRRTTIIRRGEEVSRSTFLISGFMCRYIDDRNGFRQFLSLQTPGDFVDLHGYPLQRLDHEITTLSECRVAYAPHHKITAVLERFPHLGRMLWFATVVDAALHREWIFRLGRLDAAGRVAHFLCETCTRLAAVGCVTDGAFDWPLIQQDLAEATGLTSVHVNRVLRQLRQSGWLDVSGRRIAILDFERLAALGEFSDDYLYLGDTPQTP
ncbi:Crp/Fnr family transcriptional regulator [Sphingomonas sp. 3P27F8]|uniref:Crp/Fnr family transcriptional regulator n=1 Tax=Sphingomonas sp. 3P27F8 TaxID=2502213 RepID=UPI0010F91E14|nr:Crp/Fnr family transcriptional regulator [Sphingomonas sp. 3P27F8]